MFFWAIFFTKTSNLQKKIDCKQKPTRLANNHGIILAFNVYQTVCCQNTSQKCWFQWLNFCIEQGKTMSDCRIVIRNNKNKNNKKTIQKNHNLSPKHHTGPHSSQIGTLHIFFLYHFCEKIFDFLFFDQICRVFMKISKMIKICETIKIKIFSQQRHKKIMRLQC